LDQKTPPQAGRAGVRHTWKRISRIKKRSKGSFAARKGAIGARNTGSSRQVRVLVPARRVSTRWLAADHASAIPMPKRPEVSHFALASYGLSSLPVVPALPRSMVAIGNGTILICATPSGFDASVDVTDASWPKVLGCVGGGDVGATPAFL
jgi:hypothetical protein